MSVIIDDENALGLDDNLKEKAKLKVTHNTTTESSSPKDDEDHFDPLEHGPETALFW